MKNKPLSINDCLLIIEIDIVSLTLNLKRNIEPFFIIGDFLRHCVGTIIRVYVQSLSMYTIEVDELLIFVTTTNHVMKLPLF